MAEPTGRANLLICASIKVLDVEVYLIKTQPLMSGYLNSKKNNKTPTVETIRINRNIKATCCVLTEKCKGVFVH